MLALPAAAEPRDVPRVTVESVYDGDTATVLVTGWQATERVAVRLAGIDAPELRGRCDAEREAALRARDRLAAMLAEAITLQLKACRPEKYGRALCGIEADGHDVGALLVAADLAREYDGRGARQPWCP